MVKQREQKRKELDKKLAQAKAKMELWKKDQARAATEGAILAQEISREN